MTKKNPRKSHLHRDTHVEPLHRLGTDASTPLNFKVPREFHRDFKTFAAQHSKKMVEVLQEAFALLKDKYGS